MTSEEKWNDAEHVMGHHCGVLTCPHNINGRAACGDYEEDHCPKQLFHDETDANLKMLVEECGHQKWIQNPHATGEKPFIPIEPWVKERDVIDFNHGAI